MSCRKIDNFLASNTLEYLMTVVKQSTTEWDWAFFSGMEILFIYQEGNNNTVYHDESCYTAIK